MPLHACPDTLLTVLLSCTPATLVAPPAPDGLTLQRVDAFSGSEALAELARVTAPLEGDGQGVLARLGTDPAGAGWFAHVDPQTARIAPVGVVAGHEGQGIEAVIAAELARLAFRIGCTVVVLEAAGEPGPFAAAGFAPADAL